jgi:hypothetical protein
MLPETITNNLIHIGNVSVDISTIKAIEWDHTHGVQLTCQIPPTIVTYFLIIKAQSNYQEEVDRLKRIVGKPN